MTERIVYIRRVDKNDKTRLPKDLLIDSKRPIGSSWNKYGQILKGVTGEEEKRIMPEILGVSLSDPGFGKAVEMFWKNINIYVPWGTGVKLNIAVDETGFPKAPLDYVKYQYARKHKNVAPEEKVDSSPYALFYIHDPVSVSERRALEIGVRNKAKLKYLELIQDEQKMDAVLSVATKYKNPMGLSNEEKQVILEKESDQNPEEFLKILEDENLFIRSFIYRCINAGVFKQSGARIIYDEEVIGLDISSAVAYLKSKEGSRIKVTAEGKLHQWELNK